MFYPDPLEPARYPQSYLSSSLNFFNIQYNHYKEDQKSLFWIEYEATEMNTLPFTVAPEDTKHRV